MYYVQHCDHALYATISHLGHIQKYFNPLLFIEMRVSTRKIERSCTYVQGVSILPSVSTMFGFELLQTLWYLFQFHSIFYFIHFCGIYAFEDICQFYSLCLDYKVGLHLCIVVLQRLTKCQVWQTLQIPMVSYQVNKVRLIYYLNSLRNTAWRMLFFINRRLSVTIVGCPNKSI